MSTHDSFNNDNSQVMYDFASKQTKGAFLSRVFGMMCILLLITTLVAAGVGFGTQYFMTQAYNAGNDELYTQIYMGLIGTIVVSSIALLVMSIVLPITFMRGKHNIIVPLIIYTIIMGILLSTFVLFIDWVILVEAFGITTIIFGTMAFLGYISKGRLTGIGLILSGLLFGALILSLLNWVLILTNVIQTPALSWIVSLLVFAFLMLVTLYDVNRIKRIAENGANSDNNLVHYCAFILYSDFIAILVRVIYYLSIFTRRR